MRDHLVTARPRIVLDGCYAHYNSGDEAMFACCVQRIKAVAPEAELVAITSRMDVSPYLAGLPVQFVPSVDSDWWRQGLPGARSFGVWSERAAWLSARWRAGRAAVAASSGERGDAPLAAHAASLTGAGLLWQTGGGFYNDHFARGSVSAKTFPIEVARRLGVPIVVSGQGIGPVTRPFTRRLVRRALSHARQITLRDARVSLEELAQLGLAARAVEVGDDAAGLDPCSEPARRELLASAGASPSDLTAALHVRLASYSTTDAGLVTWTASLARHLLEATPIRQILLVPMSVHAQADEREGYAKLARLAAHPGIRIVDAWMPPEVKGLLAGCAVAIGVSYHFGVFALSSGVPFVGVYAGSYYRAKSEGLLGMYDQPRHVFDWREPVEPVVAAVRAVLRDRSDLARRAAVRQDAVRIAQERMDRHWVELACRPGAAPAPRGRAAVGGSRVPR